LELTFVVANSRKVLSLLLILKKIGKTLVYHLQSRVTNLDLWETKKEKRKINK
jgi:hypothetical protein